LDKSGAGQPKNPPLRFHNSNEIRSRTGKPKTLIIKPPVRFENITAFTLVTVEYESVEHIYGSWNNYVMLPILTNAFLVGAALTCIAVACEFLLRRREGSKP
jgi:hypothetical protein